MSRMDDDLFTYEVKIPGLASIPCNLNNEDDLKQQMTHGSDVNMKYDPSNTKGDDEVELADEEFSDSDDEDEVAKIFRIDTNVFDFETPTLANIPCDLKEEDESEQRMTHGSDDDMEYAPSNARGDDEVQLTDEESYDFDNKDEVAAIFRIDTNVFDFETPMCRAFKEFNYLLQINPNVLTKDIDGFKTYEEYKDDWIYEWNKDIPWVHEKPWTYNEKDDKYCNGGNLPGAYIVGNTLCYQDLEWYEALKDGKLKDEALKNKAIMKGMIDEDDESHNEDEERCELFNDTTHERLVCNIRRFEMIKYSFGEDEEYVAIKEHEYDDLTSTNEDACRMYQEIFHRMDEGWIVTRAE
ncbi:hypothetical protein Tco_0123666 [Tanacetum coccineum]